MEQRSGVDGTWFNRSTKSKSRVSSFSEQDTEYAARKSREFPKDLTLRTPEFCAEENHHEFSYGFRQGCQWYQDKEVVRLFRRRGRPPILGPPDMSMFVKKQMLMDAVSWSVFWERRHEFDPFTSWQADFKTLKYRRSRMVGLEGQLSKGLKWSVYQFRP